MEMKFFWSSFYASWLERVTASAPSLNCEHLVVDLPHGELPAEDGRHREVPPVPRVARRHHVPRAEHLPREVGHSLGSGVPPVVPVMDLSLVAILHTSLVLVWISKNDQMSIS